MNIHFESLLKKIIEYVLSDPSNFDSESLIIKPEVLKAFNINCKNNCSERGECIISKKKRLNFNQTQIISNKNNYYNI